MRLTRDLGSTALLEALFASPLLAFAGPALLSHQEIHRLLDRAGRGAASVAELLAEIDQARHPVGWRSLTWLVKYGLLTVESVVGEARR